MLVLASMIAGLVTMTSLIVAIGAQNAYVLRQGVARAHVGAVVIVCAVSDLILVGAGVGGIGAVVERHGWVIEVARWLGVAFLLWYAVGSLRRLRHPTALRPVSSHSQEGRRRPVVLRAVALTWLNPHVYLDTVLLIGSIAATHDRVPAGRWWFAAGAGTASVLWFSALGFGARLLSPVFARPRAWQLLEIAIAVVLVVVAGGLAAHSSFVSRLIGG